MATFVKERVDTLCEGVSPQERAAIRCDGSLIDAEHLALERTSRPLGDAATDLRGLERDTILLVLQDCDWNKAQAAKRLGLTRTQLYGRMHKYGIELESSAAAVA